jgi:hypothetical protein
MILATPQETIATMSELLRGYEAQVEDLKYALEEARATIRRHENNWVKHCYPDFWERLQSAPQETRDILGL